MKRPILNSIKTLPTPLIYLGLVSFMNDFSSEMVYPLLPLFLSQQLGATPTVIGLIEGVAEATASIIKYFSGVLSDRFARKKPLILFGYTTSSLVRPFMAIASNWSLVFLMRFLDRMGKGIRTAPRDALIAEITPEGRRGQAFGFHRSLDHLGAVLGPLVASGLIYFLFFKIEHIFALAILPALVSLYFLKYKVQEPDSDQIVPSHNQDKMKSIFLWKELSIPVKKAIFVFLIFTLANSSDAFFLLKLKEVGLPTFAVTLIWAALHVVKMTSNYMFGHLSDKVGHKKMILMGWVLYAFVYFIFSQVQNLYVLIVMFLLYGIHFGMVEGPERAWISLLANSRLKGTAMGLYHMLTGVAILPASLVFGWIWTQFGSEFAFLTSSLLALASAFILQTLSFKEAH